MSSFPRGQSRCGLVWLINLLDWNSQNAWKPRSVLPLTPLMEQHQNRRGHERRRSLCFQLQEYSIPQNAPCTPHVSALCINTHSASSIIKFPAAWTDWVLYYHSLSSLQKKTFLTTFKLSLSFGFKNSMCFWINESSLHGKKKKKKRQWWLPDLCIVGFPEFPCDPRVITCCVFMPLTLMAPKYDGEIYTEEFYH